MKGVDCWRDELSLNHQATVALPYNAKAHFNKANELSKRHRTQEAFEMVCLAYSLQPHLYGYNLALTKARLMSESVAEKSDSENSKSDSWLANDDKMLASVVVNESLSNRILSRLDSEAELSAFSHCRLLPTEILDLCYLRRPKQDLEASVSLHIFRAMNSDHQDLAVNQANQCGLALSISSSLKLTSILSNLNSLLPKFEIKKSSKSLVADRVRVMVKQVGNVIRSLEDKTIVSMRSLEGVALQTLIRAVRSNHKLKDVYMSFVGFFTHNKSHVPESMLSSFTSSAAAHPPAAAADAADGHLHTNLKSVLGTALAERVHTFSSKSKSMSKSKSKSLADSLAKAEELTEKGKWKSCLKVVKTALLTHTDVDSLWRLGGVCLSSLGRNTKAMTFLRIGLWKCPGSVKLLHQIANTHHQTHKNDNLPNRMMVRLLLFCLSEAEKRHNHIIQHNLKHRACSRQKSFGCSSSSPELDSISDTFHSLRQYLVSACVTLHKVLSDQGYCAASKALRLAGMSKLVNEVFETLKQLENSFQTLWAQFLLLEDSSSSSSSSLLSSPVDKALQAATRLSSLLTNVLEATGS